MKSIAFRHLKGSLAVQLFSLLVLPISLSAQQPSTEFIPQETFGAMSIGVDRLKTIEGSQYLPHEVISALVKRDFGIDLASIKTVKAIVGWKNQEQPPLGWILESDE